MEATRAAARGAAVPETIEDTVEVEDAAAVAVAADDDEATARAAAAAATATAIAVVAREAVEASVIVPSEVFERGNEENGRACFLFFFLRGGGEGMEMRRKKIGTGGRKRQDFRKSKWSRAAPGKARSSPFPLVC